SLHYLSRVQRACEIELIGFEVELVRGIDALHLLAIAAFDSSGGQVTIGFGGSDIGGGLLLGNLACFFGVVVGCANAHLTGRIVVFQLSTASVSHIANTGIG